MISRGRPRQLRDVLEAVYALAATPGDLGLHYPNGLQDAADVWQEVIAGRWSVVEHFDSDGDRCFLVKASDPGVPPVPALTERECQIAILASRGHSNKLIAYELGVSSSTVAAQLTSAARKLGVASRKIMLHTFAVLGVRGPQPAPAHPPALGGDGVAVRMVGVRYDDQDYALIRIAIAPRLPTALTTAEAEVARLVIEGLSNAAIAARRGTSVRTVANQLRSIYAKLAVDSRRQLCSRFSMSRERGGHGPVGGVRHQPGSTAAQGCDANYSE